MKLAALPAKAADGAPDVIIMPETVIPVFQDQIAPAVWQQWIDIAKARRAHLILGVPLHIKKDGQNRYTNSAIVVTPESAANRIVDGDIAMHYDKIGRASCRERV